MQVEFGGFPCKRLDDHLPGRFIAFLCEQSVAFTFQSRFTREKTIARKVTERKSLFEPCGHRITVGPGMEGVQGEAGEKSFHLGVI
jgi:hypothetical protein